jgi:hypothetical protein
LIEAGRGPKPIRVKAFLDAVRQTLDRDRGKVSGA